MLLAGKYKGPTKLSILLTKKSKDKWVVNCSGALKTCEKVVTWTLWPPVHKILLCPKGYSGKHFYGLTLQSEACEKGLKSIF